MIALLCAVDRMQTAYGLAKHLKVYAIERPVEVLFGVPAPTVPEDARQSLKLRKTPVASARKVSRSTYGTQLAPPSTNAHRRRGKRSVRWPHRTA